MNLHQIFFKLEHSSVETSQMIQKAAAMGNSWLAASSRQHTHSCITSHAEFFGETSNYSGDSAPLQPRFGALWLLAFPKTKITFEREEFQETMTGQQMETGRAVWGLKVPTLKRTEASLSYVQCFLYLVPSSINVSIFHITWGDTFWTDLVYKNLELKSTITKLKNFVQWFKGRFWQAEERSANLQLKKSEQSLRDEWDTMEWTNICIVWVPEGEERKGQREYLKK